MREIKQKMKENSNYKILKNLRKHNNFKFIYYCLTSLFLFSCSSSNDDNPTTPIVTKSVQQRLNLGETPIHIYNSGIILDSIYGRNYKGGLIFHLNTSNGSGLLAHFQDNSSAVNWGGFGDVTDANNTAIGFGQQNSNAIMNYYLQTNTAADFCDNLTISTYNDWYLPSKDEMNKMMLILKNKPGVYFGAVSGYWTSTNFNFNQAWIIRSDNTPITSNKFDSNNTYDIRIRAVRTFIE